MEKHWIAVVDDDVMSLKTARELLSRGDLRVSVLRTGQDLLAFMEKNSPDLILLDVFLPYKDGFQIYHLLREKEKELGLKQTPVVFLTGEDDDETERQGLKLGASDFIRKPFHRDVLLQRIRNIIINTKTIESLTAEVTVDQMTGFLNKAGAVSRFTEICKTETGAMMIIDLDSFKLVNDLYGHEMGDQILMSFADIVRENTRSGDIVGRIGGDEFLAFCKDVKDESAIAAMTRRWNKQLRNVAEKLMGEDFDIPLGVSAGAVMVPEHGREYHELFLLADKMLYQVKQNGKHGYAVYDPWLDKMNGEEEDEGNLDLEILRITQLINEREGSGTAMLVGQEVFAWIYRYMLRLLKRHKGYAIKMLFSLSREKSREEEDFREAADSFGDILKQVLRRSDVIMQNKGNQFFVLLPDMLEESIPIVTSRVLKGWEDTERWKDVHIEYAAEAVDFRQDGNQG